ncbi:phosphatase 2C-like domain-containing protein [Dunaliella salina]|uniref:protein-serine/threonine phosphatase n=1 Tax=Dunaliella salina TaxID=3046 RepID=A0ABQ7GP07_DUNSA|nr:phosphatase 2C-like domain-containing protein [Dunaliella salina]|eukprot:KAF5836338.1 phosphatase 2C-like domain-containing protein [Dunaliella salina]
MACHEGGTGPEAGLTDTVVPCLPGTFARSVVIEEKHNGPIQGFTTRDELQPGSCCMKVVTAETSDSVFAVAAAASKGPEEEEGPVVPCDKGECIEPAPSLLLSAASLSASCLNSCANTVATLEAPPCGVKAVCGKRAKMEDAFSVQTCFYDLPSAANDAIVNKLPARIATQIGEQLEASLGGSCSSNAQQQEGRHLSLCASAPQPQQQQHADFSAMSETSESSDNGGDTLHFYGVYDGHGGTEAAQHCANRLHHHLSEALTSMKPACVHHHTSMSKPEGGVQCQAEWRLMHKAEGGEAGCCDANHCKGGSSCEEGQQGAGLRSSDEQQQQANLEQVEQQQQAREVEHSQPRPVPVKQPQVSFQLKQHQSPQSPCQLMHAPSSPGIQHHHQQQQQQPHSPTNGCAAGSGQADSSSEAATELISELPSTFSDFCGSGCDTSSDPSDMDAARSPSHCSGITLALEEALKEAFLRTDTEFAADGSASMVGSTAVVALVGSRKAWVANCGDSRAVLCRGSRAIQLTDDHKPEREDEAERVEKAGGQVLYWNGHRVMGVLAMSRAIGDHGLRPYVIPEPEVTVFTRAEDDDFLLLASDGLWDVMSNQEAISLAMRCSARAAEKGASRKAAVRIAASVLTKAAVDRGSKDNVTVVIIDLASNAREERNAEAPSTNNAVGSSVSTLGGSVPASVGPSTPAGTSPPTNNTSEALRLKGAGTDIGGGNEGQHN